MKTETVEIKLVWYMVLNRRDEHKLVCVILVERRI